MIRCIVCAQRKEDIQKAFTCTSCTELLKVNGFTYNGEKIEKYEAIVAEILIRAENADFLQEVMTRREITSKSVWEAIEKAVS